MEYKVIRSARRTLALQVTPDGLVVRAPYLTPTSAIESFVESHADWARRQTEKLREREREAEKYPPITKRDVVRLTEEARRVIPERVRYFADMVGVKPAGITIRHQRTRWGSCSSKGNLSFNCLLMLTPPEVIDSVVAHEVCHLRFMNHSESFYTELFGVCPNYEACGEWLKTYGRILLLRSE